MKFFAISDLHLSLAKPPVKADFSDCIPQKTMAIFDEKWENHIQKIALNWLDTVSDEDVVLIPGDISWAMTLEEANADLQYLGKLPGTKVLMRGNHDYWWQSLKKIEEILPPKMLLLQNKALIFGNVAVTGSRLWLLPGSPGFTAHDEKIYRRELLRLETSLKEGEGREIINMTHYMPCAEKGGDNEVTELISKYKPRYSLFGHMHGKKLGDIWEGERNNTKYVFVSCDYLDFAPKLIMEL